MAEAAGTHQSASASGATTRGRYVPPDPRTEAARLLREGHDFVSQALEALARQRDYPRSGDLVGHASDRIGGALQHMRACLRN